MSIYLNEPLVQKLPAFYNFMGGFDFVRSVAGLNKLTSAPRHWRGNRIAVKRGASYIDDVQVTAYQDNIMVYCNHANQKLEHVSYNAGMDDEYTYELSVCQNPSCGAGWSKDGELLMDAIL